MSKTNRGKNPGLFRKNTTKVRSEFLDYDYVNKLSEKDKQWLSKFTEEELNASLTSPKFNRKKADKKRIYDANNARNRDMYGRARAYRKLDVNGVVSDPLLNDEAGVDIVKITEETGFNSYNPEDDLIDKIDLQDEIERTWQKIKNGK